MDTTQTKGPSMKHLLYVIHPHTFPRGAEPAICPSRYRCAQNPKSSPITSLYPNLTVFLPAYPSYFHTLFIQLSTSFSSSMTTPPQYRFALQT